ncbi:MAG: transcription termination/antitermination protein NusG [Acidimicrobiia bacterium]
MTTPGTPNDNPDNDEQSGLMAEALAGVPASPAGVTTDEAPPAAPDEGDEAADATDEALNEIVEDSPFAAAAAIFEQQSEDPEDQPAEEDSAEEAVAELAEEVPVEEVSVAEVAEETPDAEPEVIEDPPVEEADAAEAVDDPPVEEADAAEAVDDPPVEEAVEAVDEEEEDAEDVLPPASPYDLPGAWYVVHSYSGYENKVKANLGTRIKSMHMEYSIFDIEIPMEDVVEIKAGRKVTVPRKQFPGYILVRMYMDDDSWGVVRNTPGVTGFVGSGTKPTPLSRREVERILGVRKDEEKKAPRFKPDWEIGETVRVLDGPFAEFNGIIEDFNLDRSKVRVLVDIFGRETPVELNFEQIQKF